MEAAARVLPIANSSSPAIDATQNRRSAILFSFDVPFAGPRTNLSIMFLRSRYEAYSSSSIGCSLICGKVMVGVMRSPLARGVGQPISVGRAARP